ncbi:MAG: LD-carboxypeptidase [Ignavibacteriae bacterium]|nr:LD-carboxypeptidase [Ignavibacteriota bacterium]MCB9206659.1 LD-carboxypeptidase [Ignavibacteriales bacterium]MCB9210635.1 LD-carboxypeptidase [Ignavibacteriales bacterium]MCB9218763.1 LD-carboxypeptidase [Ignavibacteriales bacterium]MCB9259233.1 LD-carboxypeptidase [Ignavibacteriales bacterium]
MKTLKPKKLDKGDVIGIISPASSPDDLEKIEKGTNYLEKLGYRVEIGENVGKKHGYLAGSDEERLKDFHSMFRNKDVKAVFSVRGGYGSGRLLDKIDFNLIKKNPKIFVGYSDITALQLSIYKKTGLVTFAGPMVATDFSENTVNQFAEENFWNILTNSKKIGKLHNPGDSKFFVLKNGRAEGRIIGGNLAVLVSLFGTQFQPVFKDTILIIEDIGEAPYRVDRLLNQLRLANVLKDVKGIILGRFVDCYETDKTKETITLNEVIEHYFHKIKKPILYNFSHGHIKENLTIPFGLNCKLNTSRGFVEITESAVI